MKSRKRIGIVETLGLLVLFLAVVLWRFEPLATNCAEQYLGMPGADLYDEMWLLQTVTTGIPSGNVTSTNAFNYPQGFSLLATHLSYLHVLFTAPLVSLLPWPMWWNCAITLAIVTGAYACYFAVWRISGQKWWAILAGLVFVFMPWISRETMLGHLNQLWLAPFFFAVTYLYSSIFDRKSRYCWLWLALWTVVTFLVNWMNGLFLTLVGLCLLIPRARRLRRFSIHRLLAAIVLVLVVLQPLAWQVVKAQPLVRTALTSRVDSKARDKVIKRALENSVSPAPTVVLGSRAQVFATKIGAIVPYFMLAVPLLLLLLDFGRKRPLWTWLAGALLCGVLSCGPHLVWNGKLLGDSQGQAVSMPYLMLLDTIPVLYRWSLPSRIAPITVFLACIFAVTFVSSFWQVPAKGTKQWVERVAASAVCIFIMVLGVDVNAVYPSLVEGMTSAYVPGYCSFLREQPSKGVLNLPMGYVVNVNQVQFLQGLPIFESQTPIPSLAVRQEFLQMLFLANQLAVNRSGLGKDVAYKALDRQADSTPYGRRCYAVETPALYGLLPQQRLALSHDSVMSSYRVVMEDGLGYVVVHRANCCWIDAEAGDAIFYNLCDIVGQLLGKPIYSGDDAQVFRAPSYENIVMRRREAFARVAAQIDALRR